MVTFRIISVGKPPKDWRSEAFAHYRKLISPFANIEELFVKEQKASGAADSSRAMSREAESLEKALTERAYSFALDESGKSYSSVDFAVHLESLFNRSSAFDFVIGGAYGLDKRLLDKVDEVVSLSQFTLPHDLARIALVEQLYRAISIINKLPYHK